MKKKNWTIQNGAYKLIFQIEILNDAFHDYVIKFLIKLKYEKAMNHENLC